MVDYKVTKFITIDAEENNNEIDDADVTSEASDSEWSTVYTVTNERVQLVPAHSRTSLLSDSEWTTITTEVDCKSTQTESPDQSIGDVAVEENIEKPHDKILRAKVQKHAQVIESFSLYRFTQIIENHMFCLKSIGCDTIERLQLKEPCSEDEGDTGTKVCGKCGFFINEDRNSIILSSCNLIDNELIEQITVLEKLCGYADVPMVYEIPCVKAEETKYLSNNNNIDKPYIIKSESGVVYKSANETQAIKSYKTICGDTKEANRKQCEFDHTNLLKRKISDINKIQNKNVTSLQTSFDTNNNMDLPENKPYTTTISKIVSLPENEVTTETNTIMSPKDENKTVNEAPSLPRSFMTDTQCNTDVFNPPIFYQNQFLNTTIPSSHLNYNSNIDKPSEPIPHSNIQTKTNNDNTTTSSMQYNHRPYNIPGTYYYAYPSTVQQTNIEEINCRVRHRNRDKCWTKGCSRCPCSLPVIAEVVNDDDSLNDIIEATKELILSERYPAFQHL